MLGCHGCDDETLEPFQRWADFASWLTVNPPESAICLAIVFVAFWFYARENVLVNRGKLFAQFFFLKTEEIDNQNAAWFVREISTIPIRPNVSFKCLDSSEP